jgi:predicted esterase
MREDRAVAEQTVQTQTHGRYLVSSGSAHNAPLLVGFHGYGETAEEDFSRLRAIPGSDKWTLVSIQGLHQFYRRRTSEIVASWMTRQNRELAIVDNLAYVSSVFRNIAGPWNGDRTLVLTGFSQGAAMAFRTAANGDVPVAGVMVCGGDVPPELDAKALSRIPAVLIGRGMRDDWYTAQKLAADEERLRAAKIHVETVVLDAGHEWTMDYANACAHFLQRSIASRSTL